MKKTILLIGIALVLSISVFAAIMPPYKSNFNFPQRYGVERVTGYDPRVNFARLTKETVYLEPAQADKYKGVGRGGYAPFYGRAAAIVSSSVYTGRPYASVQLTTKDLPATAESNSQFEVWLVDQDTGYRLALGTFTTQFGGTGSFLYTANMYLDPYDTIEITMQPLNDEGVTPGPTLLIGAMPKPQYFDPVPKQGLMINGPITTQ